METDAAEKLLGRPLGSGHDGDAHKISLLSPAHQLRQAQQLDGVVDELHLMADLLKNSGEVEKTQRGTCSTGAVVVRGSK